MKQFQVIIPVFQTKKIFLLCIQSLLKSINYPTELIIINDGSPFNCVNVIHENFNIPDKIQFHYIEHSHSIGCPKSINQALKFVRNDSYVIFADSDIIFSSNWQETVIETLKDPSIGAVSGIFLYPQSEGIQCCGIAYQNYLARHVYLNNKLKNLSLPLIFDVQATIFAFFAMKSNIIKSIGALDENFFNGYEDVDYQFRICEAGYRIVTNTSMIFYHFEKSNGNHRQYSRRQNLGLFWSKHAKAVKNDLYLYFEKQFTLHNFSSPKYVLINMCEAQNDANNMISFLMNRLSIDTVCDVSNCCNISQKLWLPEMLSSDSYALPKPYIFLCDNFVELTENSYWFNLRSKYSNEDIIIDLYANIMPFFELTNSFWPGNKIR